MQEVINAAISIAMSVGQETLKSFSSNLGKKLYDSVSKFLSYLKDLSEDTVNNIKKLSNNSSFSEREKIIKDVNQLASENYELREYLEEIVDLVQKLLSRQENENNSLEDEESKEIEKIEYLLLNISNDFENYLNESETKALIKKSLNSEPELTDKFYKQIENFYKLTAFFIRFPLQISHYKGELEILKRALDYTKSYTISVVGKSGVGKSTLLNALLGREILPTNPGKPVTNVKTEIVFDAREKSDEKAVIR